jgi:hypothetical protein
MMILFIPFHCIQPANSMYYTLLRSLIRNGLGLAPWSGAPNQSMVGRPASHSAIKRRWRSRLVVRGSHAPPHTPPTTLPPRGSTGAAGSSATAATDILLLDPTYMVPPVDPRAHRSRHRRLRPTTTSLASSRGRPCDHDQRDGLRLHSGTRRRWSASLVPLCSFVSSFRCCGSRSRTRLSSCIK